MKIVREYIEFERTDDTYHNLDIGKKHMIEKWLKDIGIDEYDYQINDDLTIDVFKDVNIINKELEELPEFIKFGEIHGGFYAGGNDWQTLRGFPDIVHEDLQVRSPSTSPIFRQNIQRFSEQEIEKLIKVYGQIYH